MTATVMSLKNNTMAARGFTLYRLTPVLFLLVTVLVILLLTLLPNPPHRGNRANRIKLVPFNHLSALICVVDECNLHPAKIRSKLFDLFGNIALFIPFGLFFYLAIAAAKHPARTLTWLVVWTGLLFSSLIELTQLGLPTRSPNIDDIIFNSSGTWLGVRLGVVLLTIEHRKIVRAALVQAAGLLLYVSRCPTYLLLLP
jgi:glycopeptide antibiotics resistance protein